jgi:hypothetical protein
MRIICVLIIFGFIDSIYADALNCRLYIGVKTYNNGTTSTSINCVMNNKKYTILPNNSELFLELVSLSGNNVINFTGDIHHEDKTIRLYNFTLAYSGNTHTREQKRNVQKFSGLRSVVVIILDFFAVTSNANVNTVYNTIFNPNTELSLYNYLKSCSYNNIGIGGFSMTGNTGLPNVYRIMLPNKCDPSTTTGVYKYCSANHYDISKCRDIELYGWAEYAENYLLDVYGADFDNWQHKIFIFPTSELFVGCGFSEYGSTGCDWWQCHSYISDTYSNSLQAYAHTIGHNFNFGHGGLAYELTTDLRQQQYGDYSCSMGFINTVRCYNVARLVQAGWVTPIKIITLNSSDQSTIGMYKYITMPSISQNKISPIEISHIDKFKLDGLFLQYKTRHNFDKYLGDGWVNTVAIKSWRHNGASTSSHIGNIPTYPNKWVDPYYGTLMITHHEYISNATSNYAVISISTFPCGNEVCDTTFESYISCPIDCKNGEICNNNYICDKHLGENGINCPRDCSVCKCNTSCNCFNGGICYLDKCVCTRPYTGPNCLDSRVNECNTSNTTICPAKSKCIDTQTSHECICNYGYKMINGQCIPTNLCHIFRYYDICLSASCPARTNITDECPSGYIKSFNASYPCQVICTDINECDVDYNICATNAICTNTMGSYVCTCKTGYFGIATHYCNEVNECVVTFGLTDNCNTNAKCTNTNGSFTCSCNVGYVGDGVNCDVLSSLSTMPTTKTSTSTILSTIKTTAKTQTMLSTTKTSTILSTIKTPTKTTVCSRCSHFAQCIGGTFCKCMPGYTGDGFTCNELNECIEGIHNCHDKSACTNTFGSFTCKCNVGYYGIGTFCNDINECVATFGLTDNCNTNAKCTNTNGSFTCSCNEGYVGNGVNCDSLPMNTTTTKTSMSPSLLTTKTTTTLPASTSSLTTKTLPTICSRCSHFAQCAGGVFCKCIPGYTGDGFTCVELNECIEGIHNCHESATCTNTLGSFTCKCTIGYYGTGTFCKDINECVATFGLIDNCNINAKCTNTNGSFTCECNEGYVGNGVNCDLLTVTTPKIKTDECSFTNGCDNGNCINIDGVNKCICNCGYYVNNTGTHPYNCVDVNECSSGLHNCDQACTNTIGSFQCH